MKQQINWQTYQYQFPTRYLDSHYFDHFLLEQIQIRQPQTILDIGGNTGTSCLQKLQIPVDLLDPFVSKPTWYRNQITWETIKTYDLVFARNCINYFTEKELRKIPQFLTKGGFFLANTFRLPPSEEWTEREYQTQEGQTGIERFRLQKNKIEHVLITDQTEIAHEFFYRPLAEWKNYFPHLQTIQYKVNSILLLINAK